MRCRNSTTNRRPMSDHARFRFIAMNFAWRALIEACAIGIAMATSNVGPTTIEAPQPRLRRNIPARRATAKYHSGARARDQRRSEERRVGKELRMWVVAD